jgi:hypothetical protein
MARPVRPDNSVKTTMPSFMRSWPCVLMVVAGSSGCGGNAPLTEPTPAPAQAVQSKVVGIDAPYGTLRFQGTIQRLEHVSTYEYVVRLTLTFDMYARTNSTESIHLNSAVFTATVPNPADPGGPRQLLYTDARVISADFTTHGETRTLPELRFVLPKSTEAQAGYVGAGVTDGHLLWPVPYNLKDQ